MSFIPNINILNYLNSPSNKNDDPSTWDTICAGDTRGVFQLESPLGRSWSKKVKPRSIEELAALIALIRPGVLEAVDELGINAAEHFTKRKFGEEVIEYPCAALESILKVTYGIIVYQEQAMRIAMDIAGFSSSEADKLRKAIGKKDTSLMSEVETMFSEGCKKTGIIDETTALAVFETIKKSQRYSFNKSHAVGYAVTAYQSAFIKTHYVMPFYSNWAQHTDKKERFNELILDAKNHGISVKPPSIIHKNVYFENINNSLVFGLGSVHHLGESVVNKLVLTVSENESKIGPASEWNFTDFLVTLSSQLSSTVVRALICSGSIDPLLNTNGAEGRVWASYVFSKYERLTPREQEHIYNLRIADKQQHASCKKQLLDYLANVATNLPRMTKDRKEILRNIYSLIQKPIQYLNDTDMLLDSMETFYLGVPLTATAADAHKRRCTSNVYDFVNGEDKDVSVAVSIINTKEVIIKKGKSKGEKMCFLTGVDSTGSLEAVVFSEAYKQFSDLCIQKNVVLLCGKRGRDNSLTVDRILQL